MKFSSDLLIHWFDEIIFRALLRGTRPLAAYSRAIGVIVFDVHGLNHSEDPLSSFFSGEDLPEFLDQNKEEVLRGDPEPFQNCLLGRNIGR